LEYCKFDWFIVLLFCRRTAAKIIV
jgi:hypothetical protein